MNFDDHYLLVGDQQTGPYSLTQLQEMWRTGRVTGAVLYWQEGFEEWQPLSAMAEFLEAPRPQRQALAAQAYAAQLQERSNPEGFGWKVFLTFLVPLVGLIYAVIWMCNPRYRGSGAAMLGITFCASIITPTLIFWLGPYVIDYIRFLRGEI